MSEFNLRPFVILANGCCLMWLAAVSQCRAEVGLSSSASAKHCRQSGNLRETRAAAENLTDAGRQAAIPRPALARHALERAAAMERVALVTAKRDGAAGKVALVTDFKSKLRHPRVIAVGELKTWTWCESANIARVKSKTLEETRRKDNSCVSVFRPIKQHF